MAAARFRLLRHRPADDHPDPGRVGWRLLATNNRDIGRSPATYTDLEACRESVLWLQDHARELRPVTNRSGPSTWSWRLFVGSLVVVVASRDYQRRIQADQAAAVTRDLIPAAELADLG